jgi:hypothetical protein
MHIENLVLGYHAFKPVSQKILYTDKQTSFAGNKFTLHKDQIDVTWVRESSAFTMLSWKGKSVKRMETHNDFYGFLTSAKSLAEKAPERAEYWDIGETSELELHVVGYLIDAPTLGFAKEEYKRNYYTPAKRHNDDIWYDSDEVADGAKFDFKEFPTEARQKLETILHSPTIVWNSGWSQMHNAEAFAQYEAMAKASEQIIGDTDYRFND